MEFIQNESRRTDSLGRVEKGNQQERACEE